MTDSDVMSLALQATVVAAKLAAPILIVCLVVGIVVSLLQTIFQVQDQTLATVPRLALGAAALLVTGSWALHVSVDFFTELMQRIPDLLR